MGAVIFQNYPVTKRIKNEKTTATPGALVMGGDCRGLGLVRSLGREGVPVWVIKQADHQLAATSR